MSDDCFISEKYVQVQQIIFEELLILFFISENTEKVKRKQKSQGKHLFMFCACSTSLVEMFVFVFYLSILGNLILVEVYCKGVEMIIVQYYAVFKHAGEK